MTPLGVTGPVNGLDLGDRELSSKQLYCVDGWQAPWRWFPKLQAVQLLKEPRWQRRQSHSGQKANVGAEGFPWQDFQRFGKA